VSVATTPTAPCLPPTVQAEILGWPIVTAGVLPVRVDDGTVAILRMERREKDGRAATIGWLEDRVVIVDVDPGNPEAGFWINVNLLTADGRAFAAAPPPGCTWRHTKGGSA
jgi:hypothetical protein